MEVSSHGIHQKRTAGLQFEGAVFTNLTHDHLDYHGDLQQYAAAKRLLFQLPGLKYAVLNADDKKYAISQVGTAAQELVLVGGLENWVKRNLA